MKGSITVSVPVVGVVPVKCWKFLTKFSDGHVGPSMGVGACERAVGSAAKLCDDVPRSAGRPGG